MRLPHFQSTTYSLSLATAFVLTILLTSIAKSALAQSNAHTKSTKYILRHSVTTTASPETIWGLWADVEDWQRFDTLLEYSRLEAGGAFVSGTKGEIKAEGAPRTRFKLLDVVTNQSFTERLYVPIYQVIDLKRHVAVNDDGATVFTHEVHFKGRLRFFVHLAAAGSFKKELPLVMNRLKNVAEAQEAESL